MLLTMLVLAATVSGEPAPPVTGAVSVSVLDRSGAMVTDLRAEEVTLAEDGQHCVVKQVARDPRPLALAVLVDSSEKSGQGFLADLADPVIDFVESLPEGADPMLLLIGTPPEEIKFEDPQAARIALRARPPWGQLSLYDGFAEAAQRLARKAGTRRAIVVVMTDRFSEVDHEKARSAAARATPLVLAVQFEGHGYAPCLDSLVKWSGGRYEMIGAVTGVGRALRNLRAELQAPWLVTYETPSRVKARKVEVKVSRKDTKVRVRPAGL